MLYGISRYIWPRYNGHPTVSINNPIWFNEGVKCQQRVAQKVSAKEFIYHLCLYSRYSFVCRCRTTHGRHRTRTSVTRRWRGHRWSACPSCTPNGCRTTPRSARSLRSFENQFRWFPDVLPLSNHWLPLGYYVHSWQVLPQLSCGDTCQIWMWCK